jgi:hypothetical protein
MNVQPHLMNPLGAMAAILAIAVFAFIYRWLRGTPLKLRLLWLALFSFLSIPALLFAIYYLHVLPERAWFYELRSWRGSEFLALFLGAAAGAFAALLPRILLGLPLVGLTALVIVPHIKPLLGGLVNAAYREQWEEDVCLQSTPSTCGPASVATILRSMGIAASEKELARSAFSYGGGTEAWYLARQIRSRGLQAHFDFRSTFDPSVGLPAVVGVRIGGLGHFIPVLNFADGVITSADPLDGRETLPVAEFQRRYHFTGFHLVVSKPELSDLSRHRDAPHSR